LVTGKLTDVNSGSCAFSANVVAFVDSTKSAEVLVDKRLDDVLQIMAQIAPVKPRKRSQATPKRRGQANRMFQVETVP